MPARIWNVKRLLGAVAVLLLPTLGFAHHALQSEFDLTNPSHRWTGTLRSVQWINPHSRFVIDVADESGKVTTWTFETAAPNGLRRAGFAKRGFFEPGKTYTVIGYPARDGSPIAFLEQITLPDGRTVRIWFGDPNGSN
jgi:hypothetical protein